MLALLKKTSIKTKTILLNSSIMFLWWLAFNPGFYSVDSFGVLDMVKNGQLANPWTAIWAVFVKVLTVNGTHPEIATFFFSQLLGYSVSMFAMAFFKSRTALWSSAILCGTPLIGAMGITLWHDIPMTSGLLLIMVGLKRIDMGEKNAILFFSLGALFSSFRYNGLPTLILAFGFFLFLSKNKSKLVHGLLILLIFASFSSALNYAFKDSRNVQSDGYIDWMRYDLSCYAAISSDKEFFDKYFGDALVAEDWASKSACTWFNQSKAFAIRTEYVTEQIPTAWMGLLRANPEFILKTHLNRHKYLVPIPYSGLASMPFIHTTIEIPNSGVAFLNPTLSESLRSYPRIWNFFNFIFGFAGFWLTLILLFSWWKKDFWLFRVWLVGLILNLGLFVFASISDGRFTLFVLISGQLILVGELLERVRIPMKHRKRFRKYLDRLQ
jgi:hypothetical protein